MLESIFVICPNLKFAKFILGGQKQLMLILFLYVRSANTVPLHIEIGMRILFLLCSLLEAFGDA